MTFVSTEGKCKSEHERKANAKIADERKAGENAKAILGWLKPSNARTDRIIFVLRNAANIARTATLTRLENKRALDSMRTELQLRSIKYVVCWTEAVSRNMLSTKQPYQLKLG